MKFGKPLAVLATIGLIASFVFAEEAAKTATKDADKGKKVDMKKILAEAKCPISGRKVKADKVVKYKESKVYVCCGNCVKGFAAKVKKDAKVAASANHQLVMTHQATQAKCVMNGKGPMKKAFKVAGLEVKTCCDRCKGGIEKMKPEDQIATVFGKNFDKAFTVKAVEAKKKKEAEKKKAA